MKLILEQEWDIALSKVLNLDFSDCGFRDFENFHGVKQDSESVLNGSNNFCKNFGVHSTISLHLSARAMTVRL